MEGAIQAKPVPPRHPRLRVAEACDNQALLALSRATPMEADVSLCLERDPDFFALARARGDGRTIVAECDNRIVACGSVCRRTAYLMGEPGEMGHVADLKVAAQFRRHGLAKCVLDEIARGESRREPAPYVATVAAGNTATDGMVKRFSQGRALFHLGNFSSHLLLPLRRYRVASGLEIGRVEPPDESELIELLDAYHRQYSFAPVFRDGGLTRLLDRSPGMEASSYLMARRRGRIVAAVAVWDESETKRSRVCRMSTRLRCMSRLVRTVRKAFPLPPFPVEGELLRFVYLRHPAFRDGEAEALASLVRSVVNEVAKQRLHFALFTSADDDPVVRCIQGIPRTRYRYGLLAGSNVPDYEKQIARLRGGLLYDDPALS